MAQVEVDMVKPSEEQTLYAGILEKGMYLGLLTLLITFLIYILGILDLRIALDELPRYWQMSADQYLHEAGIQAGWGWVALLGYGDFLNFIGIAFLAALTIFCYLSVIPTLLKKKDYIYSILALLEVLVLSLAASGILAAGH